MRPAAVVVEEQVLEGGARTVGPTFHGADFTAAEQRDLGIGQTLDHRQDQHLPMDQAQHLERALERQDLDPALLFRRHPMVALEILLMNLRGDMPA